jgi:two-component system, OmpR family, response regulator
MSGLPAPGDVETRGQMSRLTAMRLLVVEDDPGMASLLVRSLQREGYAVDAVGNGQDALWSTQENDYDAVVLDAMIPSPDGFEVCRRMREEGRWAPVLMLTARDTVPDRVRGLDAGADDYLTKPFALAELFARLRALTRRDPLERPVTLQVGDLSLDPVSHVVRRGDVDIALSPKEFALLQELMRRPGEVLSRTNLIDHVWDFAYDGASNVVDVYVRYLRDKVDRPFGRETIKTVRGVGYRLDPDA